MPSNTYTDNFHLNLQRLTLQYYTEACSEVLPPPSPASNLAETNAQEDEDNIQRKEESEAKIKELEMRLERCRAVDKKNKEFVAACRSAIKSSVQNRRKLQTDTDLQKQLKDQDDRISDLSRALKDSKQIQRATQLNENTMKSKADKLEETNVGLKAQMHQLQSQNKHTISSLEKKLKDAESSHQTLLEDYETLQGNNTYLVEKYKKLKTEAQQLKNTKAQLEAGFRTSKKEQPRLFKNTEEFQEEAETRFTEQTELENYQSNEDDLAAQVQELVNTKQVMKIKQKHLEELISKHVEHPTTFEDEITLLNKEKEQVQEDLLKERKVIEDLKATMIEKQVYEQHTSELQQTNEALQETHDELKIRYANRKDELNESRSTSLKLQAKVKELENQLQQLQENDDEIVSNDEEKTETLYSTALTELRDQFEDSKRSGKETRDLLNKLLENLENSKKCDLAIIQASIKEIQAENTSLKTQCNTTGNRLMLTETKVNDLKNEKQVVEDQLETSRKDLELSQAHANGLKREKQVLEDQLKTSTSTASTLDAEKKALQDKLDRSKEQLITEQTKTAGLETENLKLEDQNNKLNQLSTQLNKDIDIYARIRNELLALCYTVLYSQEYEPDEFEIDQAPIQEATQKRFNRLVCQKQMFDRSNNLLVTKIKELTDACEMVFKQKEDAKSLIVQLRDQNEELQADLSLIAKGAERLLQHTQSLENAQTAKVDAERAYEILLGWVKNKVGEGKIQP